MRGERVRKCKGEGALDSNSQQATIRPGNFFYYEKERKLCKNRKRMRERKR